MTSLDRLQRSAERLANLLERAEWIDRVAEPVHGVVTKATRASPQVRDVLSGRGIGHPAHPAVVAAPLGCWIAALVADAAGDRRGAQRLVGAGVLATGPAIATGLSDWTDTRGAERRIGFLHLVANLTTTTLYAASWRARRRGDHVAGVAHSLLGAAIATLGGWLGGHLTYAIGVGVDTTAFQGGPTEWTVVERDPDNPLAGFVADVPLLIVERDDAIHVLAARCTHRGGPLYDGELHGDCIVCPWHESRFSILDGAVRSGPAVSPQPVYETRVTEAGLEVRRAETRSLRVNPVRRPAPG